MKRSSFSLAVLLVLSVFGFSQNNSPDPSKATLDHLNSLTHQAESDWRSHEDVPHPEDPSLNDSGWGLSR